MTDKQDLYQEAMKFAKEKASISYVQRKCRCSYNDAERMLEQMVSDGVISTYNGRKGGEAVGAGGVSGPLVGIASLSANAGEPWTGGEEWEALAWHLCAEENGEDACGELLWEGGPIPEPWGDRWMKYESDAKRMIELVRKFVAAPPTAQAEGWISVDERLPEHEQSVAFVVRTDGFQQHLNGCVLGGFFVRGQRFYVPGLGLEASHWMPLPPPPTPAEGVEHG